MINTIYFLGTEIMYLFEHFLDTCSESNMGNALIDGFCQLICGGHYNSSALLSKFILKYFNPVTEPEIMQMLGIFFETLVKHRKQECLQPALLPSLFTVLEAPNESPLKEIKSDTMLKFVINATKPIYCSTGLYIFL